MNFDKRYDLSKVAAKGNRRYALDGVAIRRDGDRPYLAATDGKILAAIPCETDADVDAILPIDAIKRARALLPKSDPARIDTYTDGGNPLAKTLDGITTPTISGDFPDVVKVIPCGLPTRYLDVTLDAESLYRLAVALAAKTSMNGHAVTLRIGIEPCGDLEHGAKWRPDDRAVVVVPADKGLPRIPDDPRGAVGKQAIGLIMPTVEVY